LSRNPWIGASAGWTASRKTRDSQAQTDAQSRTVVAVLKNEATPLSDTGAAGVPDEAGNIY